MTKMRGNHHIQLHRESQPTNSAPKRISNGNDSIKIIKAKSIIESRYMPHFQIML